MGLSENSHTLAFQDKIVLLLYSLYFILKPFYFWSSGLPQVADIIMIFLILFFIFSKKGCFKFYSTSKGFLLTALIFVSYIFVVNSVWMMILNSSLKFLLTSTFYTYNFLIAALVAILYYHYNGMLIKITYNSTLISLIIQLFIYVISGGFSGGRMVGGFNNPNQLGYYSLLSLSILLFASKKIEIRIRGFILGILLSTILCFSSLSKAAILSYIGMFIFYLLSNNKNKKMERIFIVILFVIIINFVYQYTDFIQNNDLYLAVQKRITSIGMDSDDSLEGRGYYRITEYPQYWIFGAGEGEYSRFRNQSMEFHSTLGNIQVSYGLIGMILFLRLLFIALKNDGYKNWYVLLFILVYGLTHNGIRNSLFWIILALMVTSSLNNKYVGR